MLPQKPCKDVIAEYIAALEVFATAAHVETALSKRLGDHVVELT